MKGKRPRGRPKIGELMEGSYENTKRRPAGGQRTNDEDVKADSVLKYI